MISNEKNSMGELHDQAMELADKAFIAKRRGDLAAAQELHRRAFRLEAQAADLVKDDLSAEPTRSVLYRSAAAMAIDAGEVEEARRLVDEALSGYPPREIEQELLALLDVILEGQSTTVHWTRQLSAIRDLTPRQKEVLRLLAEGRTPVEIAHTLEVIRNEEVLVEGEPQQTVVSQTTVGTPGVAPVPATGATTVQTASTSPGDRVMQRNVAEEVIDPAGEKAASVDWLSRIIWFLVGLMSILLLIRFVLLASGADESAGFSQLIYSLTGWMVAPFAGLFGRSVTYPGAAGTGVIEFESLVAIVVYMLIGWGITKLAQLALGTNRTSSTVYSETERRTKL
jgi:YGGT family